MPTILEQLKEFVEKDRWPYNAWLHDDNMSVYVRHGKHVLPSQSQEIVMADCLDIATIEVQEQKQRQGLFSNFLKAAHQLNPWDVTYVENVLPDPKVYLHPFLLKNGFLPYNESYYKWKV